MPVMTDRVQRSSPYMGGEADMISQSLYIQEGVLGSVLLVVGQVTHCEDT